MRTVEQTLTNGVSALHSLTTSDLDMGTSLFRLLYSPAFNFCLYTVAHAPRNVNRRIPTLKDLENEVKAAVPTSEVLQFDVAGMAFI